MRKIYLPNYIKPIIRFFYYKNERKKVFREISIRKKQNELLKRLYNPNIENLIIFIIDGTNWFTEKDDICGGILSIASIYEETEKLKHIHNSNVIMVTHKDAHLLLRHIQFPNNITVFRFDQVFKYFKSLKKVIFHVPEYIVPAFNNHLKNKKDLLDKIPQVQINILNQNILLMPTTEEINKLKEIVTNITQTTAHERYTTKEIRHKYGIPVHKLSVFGSPEKYNRIPFDEKEDLIIVSPDHAPEKEEVLNSLKKELPSFKIQIIQYLTYMEYLNTISRAKFALTFGEGLDFYFIETVFSGGIGFAVYNEDFFTKDFELSPMIYSSYEKMKELITGDINMLNNNKSYFNEIHQKQFDTCKKVYKYDEYINNIKNFYKGNYTFK